MESPLRVRMDSRAVVCYMKFVLYGRGSVRPIFLEERRLDF